jgi:AraC-like DNA-binding protein
MISTRARGRGESCAVVQSNALTFSDQRKRRFDELGVTVSLDADSPRHGSRSDQDFDSHAMVMPSASSLQQASLFVARGYRHDAFAPCPLLSVKCMFNGSALYRADRAWFAVNEPGYLILNDQQPYEIHIASPTRVESFIVYFPRGWAEEVLKALTSHPDKLLDEPERHPQRSAHFFERFTPHDELVSPVLATLRHAHKSGPLPQLWLEQKLRDLLARMLQAEDAALGESHALPAQRAPTREELWRRLNRGRDFIHARFDSALTLSEIASAACLSPFHFLRGFKAVFRITPHEYLSACRVERAKFLLERTELPVTEICFAVGFESLGSFSSWFTRTAGSSPRAWRRRTKSNFEEVPARRLRLTSLHEF